MMDHMTLGTTTLIIFIASLLSILLYRLLSYFSKRNIPYEKVRSLFGSGNGSVSMPLLLWELYRKCKSHKIYGFFVLWKPSILIKDLELIKLVLVKDFTNFSDRGVFYDEKRDPLSGHLFALEGELWRKLRAKLSPAFTSGKMKLMFPTIMKYGDTLIRYIADKPEAESLECFTLLSKYTLSNIASTAFGIESDIFEDNSQFMKMSLKFNTPSFEQVFRSFMIFNLSGLSKLLHLKFTPNDISTFFIQMFSDAVKYREANNIVRNDFLQILTQLKKKSTDEESDNDGLLTMNQLSAQAFVFILAGFETTALAQSWALYELALNPDCQRRLQEEVDAVENWSYENIMQLEYLEMVLNEALRKYPTVPFIVRKANENFKLPNSDIVLEKGTDISISVLGLHRDPDLFPEPDRFDPERFSPNPTHEIQPYSYLPFGEGPRFCIGMRFAKMQAKVGLAILMKHYTVEPSEKTQVPAVFHSQTIQPTAKDGLWLKFKRRMQ